ncbi:hypothetical protein C8R44DRAFT_386195 [Mycena epipterygia]|nr:hypothetical protein C8R44DRAFT_386195 [Mycena epipterygia]
MHSLTRQRTPESLHSWWSDSNPPGPTISIHTLAKPLMKLMYHRQVLGLIKKNRDTPLSTEILEIYSSYLAFRYVSPSTKTAILRELSDRAGGSEDDSRALVGSVVFSQVTELLESPDRQIRRLMCRMVVCLALSKSSVLDANPCLQLVSLLRDENSRVVGNAIGALGWAATQSERKAHRPPLMQRCSIILRNCLDHRVPVSGHGHAGWWRT